MSKLIAYYNTKNARSDGRYDCYLTQSVECAESPLWWQEKGLSFTASGYGARIPARYKVKINGKWRRVYCKIYSNNGTLYIGKSNESHLNVIDINRE
jgi:hypothetical protein